MTTWLFDLGNTRLKCGRVDGDAVVDMRTIAHDGRGFAGDWMQQLPPSCDTAWIASVGPSTLLADLLEALALRSRRISLARTQRRFAGVGIRYAEPERLGVDRFLALVAAHARSAQAWLVVGVGTALTLDLIDAGGQHLGGRIAPSPTLMRESLHARAPQLPEQGGSYMDFANDTASALASGCEGAAVALVAWSVQRASLLVGTTPHVLLHGGGASALLPQLPDATLAASLVLEGLQRWARTLAAPGIATPAAQDE
jgi:type III pantothenate kinase